MRKYVAVCVLFALTGCAGKVDYIRPSSTVPPGSNSKIVDQPREQVWNKIVPELGKKFFVINNLDKASGLINVSYSGDPQQYIDCGIISSYVKNARGERVHRFAGAKSQQHYEVMDENGLFYIDRRMSLEGRVNFVFEEVSSSQTRVTANTRYIVTRQRHIRDATGQANRTFEDSLSFNYGASASFPGGYDGRTSECTSTGALERELLSLIK